MFIDLVVGILAAFALIKGFQKGFVVAAFSFLAFIVGLAAALKLSAVAAGYLGEYFALPGRWLPLLAFVVVFLLVVVLVHLGAKAIEGLLQAVMLGWLNRLAGILLYFFVYTFIFSVFLFYAGQLHLLQPDGLEASVTYPYIRPLAPSILNATGEIFPLFKNLFGQLEQFFDRFSAAQPS
ncbi:CvpA family protein [Paraflavisolibacter sp. H34]|uniref:CvpA family protein n=1 Tax=Huijunlia imazamoxiresistens TaxID=3127457 RepID=UPI00301ADC69